MDNPEDGFCFCELMLTAQSKKFGNLKIIQASEHQIRKTAEFKP
jgi:hypothetical protein